jgi:hypothetical protein
MALKTVRATWWRWPLAIVAAVVALGLILVGTVHPAGHAAQGQKWPTGVPFAGWLPADFDGCTVTVVSEFMAITQKFCANGNATLALDIAELSTLTHSRVVKEFRSHPTLDVKAIFLRERTGLTVTPMRDRVEPRDAFYGWGYGVDRSNTSTEHLTRAEFHHAGSCAPHLPAEQGEMCWETTEENTVCVGDLGGPVTQNGAIVAMMTAIEDDVFRTDCSTVTGVQAITIRQMQPWLDEMIDEANPFPG